MISYLNRYTYCLYLIWYLFVHNMIFLLLPIIIIESLFFLTITRKRNYADKRIFSIIMILSIVHSTILLITFLKIISYKGEFAMNSHLADQMTFTLLISAGTVPKLVITIFSNIGWLVRKPLPKISRGLNRTGILLASFIVILVIVGNLYGRFNFKTIETTINIVGLPEDLKGFRIVQISDLHLNSFHKHGNSLLKSVDIIRGLRPDIIVNTGDYVSYAYPEMEPFTGMIRCPEARYGNFAILGNHDMGTYHPGWTQEQRDYNVSRISEMITASGFNLLTDENIELTIGNSTVSIAGITTYGRIPDITYGDFDKTMEGCQTSDLRIFLSHDPDLWVNNREMVSNIELTLSGHTHGMQLGLESKRIKISPASIIFTAWGGLYGEKNNWLYVNRGLGTLGFPFRIGMPPEITLIILE